MKAFVLGNYEPDVAALLVALREPRRVPQEGEVQRRIDAGSALLDFATRGRTSRVMMTLRVIAESVCVCPSTSVLHEIRPRFDNLLNFSIGRYQKVVAAPLSLHLELMCPAHGLRLSLRWVGQR